MMIRVRPGGLLRCCLATLDEHANAAKELPKQGDKLTCIYCHSPYGGMIFKDGAWEWDQRRGET